MIITDANGTQHEKCPRCGGAWVPNTDAFYDDHPKVANNDILFAYRCNDNSCCLITLAYNTKYSPTPKYILHQSFGDDLAIDWRKGRCLVFQRNKLDESKWHNTYLPTLPYTITPERLKTFITFS